MDQKVWQKIKDVLRFALENPHSDFYRKKYGPLKMGAAEFLKSPDGFFKIPFLQKEELLKTNLWDRFFTDRKGTDRILFTSGTSGKEPLIVFRKDESEKSFIDFLPPKFIQKLRCILVIVQAGREGGIRSFFGRIPVLGGSPYDMHQTAAIAAKIGIDSLYISPDLLTPFLAALGPLYDLKNILLVVFRGAKPSDAKKKLFRNDLPNALFMQVYGSTEAGHIATQCEALAKKEEPVFHVREDKFFVEVIPETDGDTAGEIVLTDLQPTPSLLIRYRTGDLGEWIQKKCGCGNKFPLLKLHGRKELDKVKMGGFEIHKDSFESVLKEFGAELEDRFEAHFYQQPHRGGSINEIVLKVAPKNGSKPEGIKLRLEGALNQKLRISNLSSFQDLIRQRIFLPIRVDFLKNEEVRFKPALRKKLIPHF